MKFLQKITLVLFIVMLPLTLYQWIAIPKKHVLTHKLNERYDKSLNRITTINHFISYIDTIAQKKHLFNEKHEIIDSSKYVSTIDSLLKERFYHGYSYYSLEDNYMAYLCGMIIRDDLSAIVLPNDILKYNHAACSQQAIVFQELLRKKKFNVRKVGFNSSISGHFCTEVKYNNKIHFFDTNLEAEWDDIDTVPNTNKLIKNQDLLAKVYPKLDKKRIAIFTEQKPVYGKWNEFPAKNARILHITTKILSHVGFIFLGILYLIVYKKRKI